MTHEKKLSELTARIREELPRLKEIQRGYKFLHIPDKRVGVPFEYEVLDVYGGMPLADTGDYDNSFCTVVSDYDGIEDCWLYEDVEAKEIIGCEPMLNDVLEWITDKRDGTLISVSQTGEFLYELDGDNFSQAYGVDWDLTKPYLKDQSEELIDYLWNLK